MNREVYVPDTHALFWYEFNSPLLSRNVRRVFDSADHEHAELVLHPIVLAEFYYVLRKTGCEQNFPRYLQFIERNSTYRLESITLEDLEQLPHWSEIPEMHDRLIAIAADRLGAVLLTKDAAIQSSPRVKWLW